MSVLKQALKIRELECILENISADDKRDISSYTDAEIIHEAKYCLSCFHEGGHQSNAELIGEAGPEMQRDARRQVAALKRLISKAA